LVLLAALAWILPVTKPLVVDGLQRAVTTQTDDDAVVDIEREEMLLVGWEAFREHPWLGIGYHNLGERIGEDFSREIESHNIVLTLLAECGWPGLIIFCVMIWEFFKRTNRARKMLDAGTGSFCAACQISLVAALLTGMAFPLLEFPLFYAVLGLGYASTVTSRNSTARAFSHSALSGS
jgi:O-antigen ligase